uniref:E3 ubiquitin-protein ligase TRIM21-like n=1 Tax=Anabas testudineus TaxID=64144 RepID=A0A7N6FG54_ANATE
MSAASCLLSEDQFLCSICLDVFTDPVSTPCGHNFCKDCITEHWDTNNSCQCPLCNKIFYTRPELDINTFISMVSQFKHEAPQKTSSSSSEQQVVKPGEVPCDVCTGTKLKALKRLKIQEIKHSVKISQKDADREKVEGVQVFTALKESVERGLNKFLKEIEDKQKTTEKQAEYFIQDLEQEISELMERSSEVRVRPPSYEGTVVRAVAQLEETLSKEMKKLFEAELKRVQQFAVDVTLDPDTANPYLILSEDGKQGHSSDVKKKLPEHRKRFSPCFCVLGKQSFSSGRFYCEVQVKGKTEWDVGVVRESIKRKGNITITPKYGFWAIWLRNGNEYCAREEPSVDLFLKSRPEKVGVFVDYEEGLVSFYDVDTAALIYSFTGCCFNQKLHPYFCPSDNDDDENSAPLIICPVKQTV